MTILSSTHFFMEDWESGVGEGGVGECVGIFLFLGAYVWVFWLIEKLWERWIHIFWWEWTSCVHVRERVVIKCIVFGDGSGERILAGRRHDLLRQLDIVKREVVHHAGGCNGPIFWRAGKVCHYHVPHTCYHLLPPLSSLSPGCDSG